MTMLLPRAFVSRFAAATVLCAGMGLNASAFAKDFEVWLVDQSNSNGKTFGGSIHIYDGDRLHGKDAASAAPSEVVDLSGATAAMCVASTGAAAVRPHMLFFDSTHRHAILSFVTSGHVVIFDAARRSGYSAANGPNTPAPVRLYSDDGRERDAHGLAVMKRERFIWVLDRIQNVAEVFDTATGVNVQTVDLNLGGPAGLAPDLADVSPSGNRVFVSLRGPNPLSGDPHASTGSTPGLAVIQVQAQGARGVLKAVVPIHNIDAAGIERADAHGIRVRLK